MPTKNLGLFGHDGLARRGAVSVSSAQSANPADFLSTPSLHEKWHSAFGVVTGVTITLDLGEVVPIGGTVLNATNLDLSATRRVEIAAVPGFSPLLADSGLGPAFDTSAPVLYGPDGLPWTPAAGRDVVYFPPAEIPARYFRWTLNNAGNAWGFLAAAFPTVGSLWQPGINFDSSWLTNDLPAGESGAQGILRGQRCNLHRLTRPERSEMISLSRVLGTTGRVYVCPEPTKPEEWLAHSWWGRFEQLVDSSPVTTEARLFSLQVSFREVDE